MCTYRQHLLPPGHARQPGPESLRIPSAMIIPQTPPSMPKGRTVSLVPLAGHPAKSLSSNCLVKEVGIARTIQTHLISTAPAYESCGRSLLTKGAVTSALSKQLPPYGSDSVILLLKTTPRHGKFGSCESTNEQRSMHSCIEVVL